MFVGHLFDNRSIIDILENQFGKYGYNFERKNNAIASSLPQYRVCVNQTIELFEEADTFDWEKVVKIIKTTFNSAIDI